MRDFCIALILCSLYFLAKALKKYHIRYILLAVILTMVLPMFLVNSFQKTLATGIYAISYEENTSNCRFETIDENTLRGKCELTFENHSKNEVQFAITFTIDTHLKKQTNDIADEEGGTI